MYGGACMSEALLSQNGASGVPDPPTTACDFRPESVHAAQALGADILLRPRAASLCAQGLGR